MKILAIKWRQLGDTVLWTPSLHALRQHFPTAEIHLAYPETYAELLSERHDFQRKYFLPADRFPTFSWIRELRRERYDWILNFHASSRSRWLARLARGNRRLIHHHSREGKRFSSDMAIVNAGVPQSAQERDLNVVRTLGWQGESPRTRIDPSPAWVEEGVRLLTSAGKDSRPLVAFAPFASRLSKQWPLARYRDLAKSFGGDIQVAVLFDTTERRNAISSFFPEGTLSLLTPKLSTLIGVLTHADLVLGSDSGVKHLAIALGKKTVSLFGPESLGEWHGYSRTEHPALQRKVACRDRDPVPPEFAWCDAAICPLSSHACLNTITTEDVRKTVLRSLPEKSPH